MLTAHGRIRAGAPHGVAVAGLGWSPGLLMKIALVVPGGVDRSGTHRIIPALLALISLWPRSTGCISLRFSRRVNPANGSCAVQEFITLDPAHAPARPDGDPCAAP